MADEFSEKLLRCALWYAKKGWPVIALHSIKNGACTCKDKGKCEKPGKHPRYEKETLAHGPNSGTTQDWIIKKWWGQWPLANIGIATGKNSFDVIDIDRRDEKDGLESLREIESALGIKIPDTMEQITGSGSYQRMFQWAGGQLQNAVGFAPGLDIRTDGGLVVVPPSLHISGNNYEWEASSGPWNVDLAPFPPSLLDYIMKQTMGANGNGTRIDVASILSGLGEGSRDRGIFRYACRLREKNLQYEEAQIILLGIAARCTPPFPEKEALKKLNQAWKYQAGGQPDALESADSLDSPNSPDYLYSPDSPGLTRTNQNTNQDSPAACEWPDEECISVSTQPSVNQSQLIRDWVETCDGIFTIQDMAREMQFKSTKSYSLLKFVLHTLVKENTLERVGATRGVYRKVEKDLQEMDWWACGSETEYDIELPLGISEMCKILPKNIVIVAGEKSAAKTAFALNVAKLNMNRTQVHYFTSEMGKVELRERLAGFDGMSLGEWRRVRFYDKCTNFQDFVQPNDLNIVDYLEIHEDFFRVGGIIRSIYDKLEKGIAIVCLQKKPGVDVGKGGVVTLEKARLAIALSTITDANGKTYNQAKIVDAKTPRDLYDHPKNKVIDFYVFGGAKIKPRSEWRHEAQNPQQKAWRH